MVNMVNAESVRSEALLSDLAESWLGGEITTKEYSDAIDERERERSNLEEILYQVDELTRLKRNEVHQRQEAISAPPNRLLATVLKP